MVTIPIGRSGNADIDGVLWGSKWSFTTLLYSFPKTTAEWSSSYAAGLFHFSPFSNAQAAAAVHAMKNVDAVCGLKFQATATLGAGNIRWGMVDQVNYFDGKGFHVPGGSNQSAEGNPPDDSQIPNYAQGDIWFTKVKYNSPTIGSFAYAAGILHELGHAVGLKHGMVAQTHLGSGITFPKLPANHDSQEYSVMTYNLFPSGQPNSSFLNLDYPTTLMQDDIAALQYMYGADFTTNASNTVYRWSKTTGETFVNGVSQGKPFHNKIFCTIWDGGGSDTYDFSNYTTSVNVNLNPGSWSTPSNSQRANLGDNHFARGSIANALLFNNDPRSLIEHANGGSGNDLIIGNRANNVLKGNGGNDHLRGSNGNDLLIGGVGSDLLNGGPGSDKFLFNASLTSGRDTISQYEAAFDTIVLENAIYSALGAPKASITSAQFFKGTAAHDSNDRIIYSPGTGYVIYDSNGSASGGAHIIAQLTKNLAITYHDFQVI